MLRDVNIHWLIVAITETSDPFFTIELNNKAIFQTEEYDKNLNPSLTKEPIVGVLMSAKELDTLKVVVADFQNIGEIITVTIPMRCLIKCRETSSHGLCIL